MVGLGFRDRGVRESVAVEPGNFLWGIITFELDRDGLHSAHVDRSRTAGQRLGAGVNLHAKPPRSFFRVVIGLDVAERRLDPNFVSVLTNACSASHFPRYETGCSQSQYGEANNN